MSQAGNHDSRNAPFRLPRALPKQTRRLVEDAIERHIAARDALIAFLDDADGDSDFEPGLAGTGGDDREYDPADPPANEGIDENEFDGPADIDDEHELGWPEWSTRSVR